MRERPGEARRRRTLVAAAVMVATVSASAGEGGAAPPQQGPGGGRLPELVVPLGLGVNIHFTGAPARDLDMLKEGGFGFIRMDFVWSSVERTKGVYEFERYDELTKGLAERGIRILYILDYSNELYEEKRSVVTAAGRRAFARFAAAAAERYRGRGIVWELWNEPNIAFWQPQPSLDAYMALAHEVFPAVRRADPDAVCVAPATSEIPLEFLEGCFKQGLLDLVDAVTVHPYRQSPPETAARDVLRLRALIAKHRPDRPGLPVISGEWGYSVAWSGYSRERQGRYLPREFLTNMSLGIPVSIWYDWHDDGRDPKEAEHNFGTVTIDREPKPAYLAMQRLVAALRGMRFVKRLFSDEEDRLLLFADAEGDGRRTVAAWTTGEPHGVELFPGKTLRVSEDPQYVPVPPDAREILAEGAWTVTVNSFGVRAGRRPGEPLSPEFTVRVRNPFDRAARVDLSVEKPDGLDGRFRGVTRFRLAPGGERSLTWTGVLHAREDAALTVSARIAGHTSSQRLEFVCLNPVSLRLVPFRGGPMAVIDHEPGDGFEGILKAEVGSKEQDIRVVRPDAQGGTTVLTAVGRRQLPLETFSRPGRLGVGIPLPWTGNETLRARLVEGAVAVSDSGVCRIVPLDVTTKTARALDDGDANVAAEFELREEELRGRDAPAESGLAFKYEYAKGWKFVRIAPSPAGTGRVPVEGKPREIGVWVEGDGTPNRLRMRYRDRTGRTFQPDFGQLDFKGWRFLSARLDDPNVGKWGGEGDASVIAYPIEIDTYVLLDGTKEPTRGEVRFAGFCLLYREEPRPEGKLTWAPPALENPATIEVTNAKAHHRMDPDRDYVVSINEKITAPGGVVLVGGRNVVLVGGEVEIPWQGPFRRNADGRTVSPKGNSRRGLYLKHWTGTMHVEGVWLHGEDLGEGINVDTRTEGAVLQIQNCRVDGVHGRPEESKKYTAPHTHHPDIVQNWGGPTVYRIDRLTGSSDYQGFMLQPQQFGPPTKLHDWRRVNFRADGGGHGYLIFRARNCTGEFRFEDVWMVARPKTPWRVAYPHKDPDWERFRKGEPPGGDFVPEGVAGMNYVSPGYAE